MQRTLAQQASVAGSESIGSSHPLLCGPCEPVEQEYFDAPLIPRRRAHRRLRKRQRASHRKQKQQDRRRAKRQKSKWLGIIASAQKKRRQQQDTLLEQREIEGEAARELIDELHEQKVHLKGHVGQLEAKVERLGHLGADLELQHSYTKHQVRQQPSQHQPQQQQQNEQQQHKQPWDWSEEELLQLVDQQEAELETADRKIAEQNQQQEQLYLQISEQNLQMANQQVHIETLERLL